MSISTPGVRPDIPFQVITPADVRASIARARRSLERAAEEIVWQIEMEAWVTLGYSSWGAMREAEYGGAAFMVPSKSRPEIVRRIKEIEVGKTARGGSKHLTNQEIADTAGVSERQVRDDLHDNNKSGRTAEIVDPTPGADDDVIDAEIVPDDDPIHVDTQTGEVLDAPNEKTDPAATESVTTITCPTCHGTGKVTR